jgi:hypothetical protein
VVNHDGGGLVAAAHRDAPRLARAVGPPKQIADNLELG